MAELIKANNKLTVADDAFFRNKNIDGPVQSILTKGRTLFFSRRRKTASIVLDRLWIKAGKRVMTKLKKSDLENTAAMDSVNALIALGENQEKIQIQLASLGEDLKKMDLALESMPGKGHAKKRSTWIEKNLNKERDELEEAFRSLGRSWLETGSDKISSSQVREIRDEWVEIDEKIRRCEKDKQDLKAHCRFLEMEAQRDGKNARMEKLDMEVKSRQANIKGIKKELEKMEKELEILKAELPPLPEN